MRQKGRITAGKAGAAGPPEYTGSARADHLIVPGASRLIFA